jgi:hypothetical protein
VIGGAIEWLQSFVGRESSWDDVRLDLTGAALAFAGLGREPKARLVAASLAALAFGALIWLNVRPFAIAVVDEYRARRDFPVLADFSTSLETGRWSSKYPMQVTDAPEGITGKALRIQLQPARYSGFSLKYFPGDWRGYRYLNFRIHYSAVQPADLTCRVHDTAHDNRYEDRFNSKFGLVSGWNSIRIALADIEQAPVSRVLDLTQVAEVGCFLGNLVQPTELYLVDAKLE